MDDLDRYLDFENQQKENETSIDFNRSKNNSFVYSNKEHVSVIHFTPMKKKPNNNFLYDITPVSIHQKIN